MLLLGRSAALTSKLNGLSFLHGFKLLNFLEVPIMRSFAILIFCILILPVAAAAQGVIKTVAGPMQDRFQIFVTLIPETDADTWKTQSFTLDIDPIKKGQQPNSYLVDLTSNKRNLNTDEKKQKILDLHWAKTGDVQAQCQDGSWVKSSGPEIDKIVETVKALLQIAPVETQRPIEIVLPKDITQKITEILNGLETSKLPCVRDGDPNN